MERCEMQDSSQVVARYLQSLVSERVSLRVLAPSLQFLTVPKTSGERQALSELKPQAPPLLALERVWINQAQSRDFTPP